MTQVARCNYFAPQTTTWVTWHRWPAQKYSLQVLVTSWQVRKWEQENWSVIPIDTMNTNIICTRTYCPYTDVGVFYPVHAVCQHHKNAVKHTENSLCKAKNIKINILEEKETLGHYKKSSISMIINYVCVTPRLWPDSPRGRFLGVFLWWRRGTFPSKVSQYSFWCSDMKTRDWRSIIYGLRIDSRHGRNRRPLHREKGSLPLNAEAFLCGSAGTSLSADFLGWSPFCGVHIFSTFLNTSPQPAKQSNVCDMHETYLHKVVSEQMPRNYWTGWKDLHRLSCFNFYGLKSLLKDFPGPNMWHSPPHTRTP